MSDIEQEHESDASGVIRAAYDWSKTEPSAVVIEMIAIACDRDPTALDPLYDSIDPDALDAFFRSSSDKPAERSATVSFVHAGHDVVVRGDGSVVVRPLGSEGTD